MAGTGDFSVCCQHCRVTCKAVCFDMCHVVVHLNVVYLISFAGSNICAVCFVNINSSRESVGKAKVISESNWNWCDSLKMCSFRRNFVMGSFNVQDGPCAFVSNSTVGLPWHDFYKKVSELVQLFLAFTCWNILFLCELLITMVKLCVFCFFFSSQYTLQSVRGHSALVLTVTMNGMQEIHPMICLLFRFSHKWLMFGSSKMRFLYHIQPRTTVGRTPLDEWSACRASSMD
jgi:hypothetical protein